MPHSVLMQITVRRTQIASLMLSIGIMSLAVLPGNFFAQDTLLTSAPNPVRLYGYIKYLPSVYFEDNIGDLVTGNFIHHRLNSKWDVSNQVYIRAELRNRIFYGEQVRLTPFFGDFIELDEGLVDLSYNLVEEEALVVNTRLDRLLVNWAAGKWDITLGRQRINWGINLVWNPNDLFNAFNYFDFDYEERPGSDALRVQFSTGTVSSVEFAYKFDNHARQQIGALLYKTNFKKYDWQALAGIYLDDIAVGTGWAGNLRNTGFKGEMTYFHPRTSFSDTSGVFVGSVALDRTFKGDYFATVSYLYNSGGTDVFFNTAQLTNIPLSAKNLMPFRHTLFAQASKNLSPIVNGSMSFMFSPAQRTLILFPAVYFSMSEDWDLAFIGQSFFAEDNGSYGSRGQALYLRLRWSY